MQNQMGQPSQVCDSDMMFKSSQYTNASDCQNNLSKRFNYQCYCFQNSTILNILVAYSPDRGSHDKP